MYKLIKPFLFSQDPEAIHERIGTLGEYLGHSHCAPLMGIFYNFHHFSLESSLFGMRFPNPVGLAAGFDKKARLLSLLPFLGFGFAEVGTVTPRPQEGNPRPRLFRLDQDAALINRMGFNNEGVDRMLVRLAGKPKDFILGVNIGKNKDTPQESTWKDYEECFLKVSDLADYIVVNVSSPNTSHLRELQEREPLTFLIKKIQARNKEKVRPKPVLLKIAPDLHNSQLDDIISVVKETKIAGIIATNTTTVGAGGLSGRPLRKRSTEVIRYLFQKSTGTIPIIGVGGIFSAEDAYEKIRAGASLVQLYTGLVYEGPGLVKKINQGLVKFLQRDGFSSIQEAVGKS